MIRDASPQSTESSGALSHYIEVVVKNFDQVSLKDKKKLRALLLAEVPGRSAASRTGDQEDYGPNFSMQQELNEQLKLIRLMREHVLEEGFDFDEDEKGKVDLRGKKEVIAACNSFFNSLMKYHETIVNLERLRLVEKALVTAVKEFSESSGDREGVYEEFMRLLKEKLGDIK